MSRRAIALALAVVALASACSSAAATTDPEAPVTIRYQGDDEDMAETYLVGHIEEKTEHDVISPTSPLGAALMGKRAGEEIEYDAPGGVLRVHILKAAS